MSLAHLFLAALLVSPAALAGKKPKATDRFSTAGPASEQAAASPLRYEPALKNYRSFASLMQTPDQGWRAANRQVAELGGHAGNMADDPRIASSKEPAQGGQAQPARGREAGRPGSGNHMHH